MHRPDKSETYTLKLSEEELDYLSKLLREQPSPDALADALYSKLSLIEECA